jgi:hypothetical protein
MSPRTRRYLPIVLLLVLLGVALIFAPPASLKGAAAEAGCTPQDLIANEKARAEGRYVALEMIAVMGAGLAVTLQYGEATTNVLVAQAQGQPAPQLGCYSTSIVESNGIDGSGKVSYDFTGCDDQSGTLSVEQGPVLIETDFSDDLGGAAASAEDAVGGDASNPVFPDGVPDGLPEDLLDNLPDDFPENLEDLSEDDLAELLTSMTQGSASTAVTVSYEGYREGLLNLQGGMTLGTKIEFSELVDGGIPSAQSNPAELVAAGLNKGELVAALTTSLLDFQGTVMLAGSVELDLDNGTTRLNMGGTFRSITGLDWEIIINDLVVGADCLGALSGDINAIFDSPAGRVDVIATADGACNGCLKLEIDGVEQEDLCLPDIPGVQL